MSGRVLRSGKRKLPVSDNETSKKSKPTSDSTVTKALPKKRVTSTSSGRKSKHDDSAPTGKTDDEKPAVPTSTTTAPNFWLFKAEPNPRITNGHDVSYSLDTLQKEGTTHWEGVRNHEAKNNMVKMKLGDLGFFYESNCKVPGVVGIVKVCKEAYVDFTAFDTTHPYYDTRSNASKPTWHMVDVEYVRRTKRRVTLQELKEYANTPGNPLSHGFGLVTRGRLSVVGVKKEEWDYILELEEKEDEE